MKQVTTRNYFKTFFTAVFLLTAVMVVGQQSKTVKTGYAPVNGLKMYYEVHGTGGSPMVLLHGAYQNIDKMFREIIATYSKTRKVIALEFQGHGRTNDIDRDITYENLADDVSQLLQYLKVDSVDVFGFSMGSNVGLQLAIRHPAQVKKMVLLSGSYSYDGMQPIFIPLVPTITAAMFEGSSFKHEYDSLSPHPAKFPVLVERLKKLDMTPFNWEADYVKIKKPLFIICGDNDVVTLAHVTDMITKLGGNVMGDLVPMPTVRLAVLPYTTHLGMMSNFKWVYPSIDEFLQ